MTKTVHRGAARAIQSATAILTAAGVPDAGRDARILAAATTGLTRELILREPDILLDDACLRRFNTAITRRARREPVSRIVGYREFMGLRFDLGESTLDPRPDSETLVETVMVRALAESRPLRILDAGTGTGCLLLSILSGVPSSHGIGTDISEGACLTATANAARLGLGGRAQFVVCEWVEALSGDYDVVVSNPPYIPSADIDGLAPEVRTFDPRTALDGGPDGLHGYRALAPSVGQRLAFGGILVVEIGPQQSEAVTRIFASVGLGLRETRPDLAGRPRALVFGHT